MAKSKNDIVINFSNVNYITTGEDVKSKPVYQVHFSNGTYLEIEITPESGSMIDAFKVAKEK